MAFHLLLVDDQVALLDSLSRRFERRGFKVFKAATLSEAIHFLKTETVDISVCDLELNPQETGIDLLNFVKKEMARTTPIIILTGHDRESELVQRAVEAGAFSIFTKPTDFGLLLDAVRTAMENVAIAI
jgi:DNA-binding response OmpR family regulator